MRRAISWPYCAPKSSTATVCVFCSVLVSSVAFCTVTPSSCVVIPCAVAALFVLLLLRRCGFVPATAGAPLCVLPRVLFANGYCYASHIAFFSGRRCGHVSHCTHVADASMCRTVRTAQTCVLLLPYCISFRVTILHIFASMLKFHDCL